MCLVVPCHLWQFIRCWSDVRLVFIFGTTKIKTKMWYNVWDKNLVSPMATLMKAMKSNENCREELNVFRWIPSIRRNSGKNVPSATAVCPWLSGTRSELQLIEDHFSIKLANVTHVYLWQLIVIYIKGCSSERKHAHTRLVWSWRQPSAQLDQFRFRLEQKSLSVQTKRTATLKCSPARCQLMWQFNFPLWWKMGRLPI